MMLGKIISNSFRQTFTHFKVWLWSFLSTILGSSFNFQPHNSFLDIKIFVYYSCIFITFLYLSVFGQKLSIEFDIILIIQIITFILFLIILTSQALGSYTKIKLIRQIVTIKKPISSNQVITILFLRLSIFFFSILFFLPIVHFIISFFPQIPFMEDEGIAILLILVTIIPVIILYSILMVIFGFILQNIEIIISMRSIRLITAFKLLFRVLQKHFFYYLLSWLSIFSLFLITDIFLRFSMSIILLFIIMFTSFFTALSPVIGILFTIIVFGFFYFLLSIISTFINSLFASYWTLSIDNHLKKLTK